MYSTTGFTRAQIDRLIILIMELKNSGHPVNVPSSLGLRKAVIVTLTYLRRNRAQADLAETFDTSQPTISRAISAVVPLLQSVSADWVPAVEHLHDDVLYVIDGTLLPCWSWAAHPELYSGKHHTTGLNVQVAATLDGHLAWVSDPTPGATHDTTAIRNSGLLEELPPANLIADKGYVGTGMITPIKHPPGRELSQNRKNFNTEINRIRYVVERTIAHLKTWRILHADYRRPYATFHQVITTVIGLEFLRRSW